MARGRKGKQIPYSQSQSFLQVPLSFILIGNQEVLFIKGAFHVIDMVGFDFKFDL